jgi:hypothetical protein
MLTVSVLQDTSATDGKASGYADTLIFGIDQSSTRCRDAALGEDELPPLPPSGVFDVRFTDNYLGFPCLGQGVKINYQPFLLSNPNEFGFTLKNADAAMRDMLLRWDKSVVAVAWDSLILSNDLNIAVNMASSDSVLIPRTYYLNRYLYFRGTMKRGLLPTFTITTVAGPGGFISPGGSLVVDSGSSQPFVFGLYPGYVLDSVFVDGSYIGRPASYEFTNIVSSHTLRATFRAASFTVHATAGPGGTIFPTGDLVLSAGANKMYSMLPAAGYAVDSVLVDRIFVGSANYFWFSNILADHSIHVVFRSTGPPAPLGARLFFLQDTSTIDGIASGYADTLTFGLQPSATLCLDQLLGEDELPPRPPTGVFDVRFADEYANTPCLGQGVRVDYQPSTIGIPNEFGLSLMSGSGTMKDLRIRWDKSLIAAQWDSLVITNDFGASANMIAADSIVFTRLQYLNRYVYVRGKGKGSTPIVYTILASAGPGGSITPNGIVFADSGTSHQFVIQPGLGYVIDSLIVDDAPVALAPSYVFSNISGNHTIRAAFRLSASGSASFRTLTVSDLVAKNPVKRKPVAFRFTLILVNQTSDAASGLSIQFGGTSRNIVTIESADRFGAWTTFDGREWNLSGGTVVPGESVAVSGTCAGAQATALRWRWAYPGGVHPNSRATASFVPSGQIPYFPMPNGANAREELFAHTRLTGGLTIGVPRADSALWYGWVRLLEGYRLRTSLEINGRRHVGTPICFGFHREKRLLTPNVENNAMFANVAVLKMNIAVSALGITPVGFGELEFIDTVANPLDGKTVGEIAAYADSLLSGYYIGAVRVCESPVVFGEVNDVLSRLNESFAGPFDTVSFAGGLVLKGVRDISAVPFLHRNPNYQPRTVDPKSVSLFEPSPSVFAVHQNYPNPFNPSTSIQFELPWSASVTLVVYNQLGQEVAALYRDNLLSEGVQEALFDGSSIGSGIYYYKLTAVSTGEEEDGMKPETLVGFGKMLLLK